MFVELKETLLEEVNKDGTHAKTPPSGCARLAGGLEG